MAATTPDDAPLTRTERRWLATHDELLAATIEELLGPTPNTISAASIAQRADRAAGTFFNHFDSVESAVSEAMQPVEDLRELAASVLESSDDPKSMVAVVLGHLVATVASTPKVFLAIAAARSAGHALPAAESLCRAVINALGGETTANHLAYTNRMVVATMDHAVVAFSRFEHPIVVEDLRRLAWNLVCAGSPPDESREKIVEEALFIALDRLGLEEIEGELRPTQPMSGDS